MRTPVRLIATLAFTLFTIGFLVTVWKGCQRQPAKSKLELAADSVAHYHEKARIAHDSVNYYDAKYQQFKAAHDSLANRLFRRDPGLAAERDSLRTVIQQQLRDSLRVRAARQRAALPKAQTTPQFP
jgi:hypothetical protein